jgi:hypothetical protein
MKVQITYAQFELEALVLFENKASHFSSLPEDASGNYGAVYYETLFGQ